MKAYIGNHHKGIESLEQSELRECVQCHQTMEALAGVEKSKANGQWSDRGNSAIRGSGNHSCASIPGVDPRRRRGV